MFELLSLGDHREGQNRNFISVFQAGLRKNLVQFSSKTEYRSHSVICKSKNIPEDRIVFSTAYQHFYFSLMARSSSHRLSPGVKIVAQT